MKNLIEQLLWSRDFLIYMWWHGSKFIARLTNLAFTCQAPEVVQSNWQTGGGGETPHQSMNHTCVFVTFMNLFHQVELWIWQTINQEDGVLASGRAASFWHCDHDYHVAFVCKTCTLTFRTMACIKPFHARDAEFSCFSLCSCNPFLPSESSFLEGSIWRNSHIGQGADTKRGKVLKLFLLPLLKSLLFCQGNT